jgi:hypothetical protein
MVSPYNLTLGMNIGGANKDQGVHVLQPHPNKLWIEILSMKKQSQ